MADSKKATSRKRSIASSIRAYLSAEGVADDVEDTSGVVVDHLVACHEQFVFKLAEEIVNVGSRRSDQFQVGVKDVSKAMVEMGLDEIVETAQQQQRQAHGEQPPKTKKAKKAKFTQADAAEQDRLMEASKAKMMKSSF